MLTTTGWGKNNRRHEARGLFIRTAPIANCIRAKIEPVSWISWAPHRFRVLLVPAICLSLIGVLTGCDLLTDGVASMPIEITSDRVHLAWDPPPEFSENDIGLYDFGAGQYNVFVRQHGVQSWDHLATVEGDKTSLIIEQSELPYGSYEFAVEYIDANGERSDLHASTDTDAWPVGGWFVVWGQP